MKARPPSQYTKRQVTLGAIGLAAGGLAPLVTGLIGVWEYLTRGYITPKTGELIYGLSGIVTSAIFILAGLGMICYAIWLYHRYRQRGI